MNYAALSLVFLIGAILIGFFRKINMGFVAFGLSLVLAQIAGVKSGTVITGFPTKLFVTLLGVMFLFSIAQQNRTLELLARKIVNMAGNRTNLIPIIVYIFSTILAGVGPGTVPVMSLMAVFTCSLAAEMKTSPVLLSATSVLGAAAGGLTPIAPTGILGLSLAEEQGITGIEFPYAANMVMAMTVYFIVIYIVLKGYRLKSAVDLSVKEKISFNTQQKITLVGIAVLVVTVIFMGFDVGLMSYTIAFVLLLFRVADEKKSVASIPWGTLLMISGINMLMALVIQLGGIDLLARGHHELVQLHFRRGYAHADSHGHRCGGPGGRRRLDPCAALRHHQHGQRGRNEPHLHRRLHGSCGLHPDCQSHRGGALQAVHPAVRGVHRRRDRDRALWHDRGIRIVYVI